MHRGLTVLQTTGSEVFRSLYLTLLAAAYQHVDQPAQGLQMLTAAWALAQTTGEGTSEAERHRIKGQLLLQLSGDNHSAAETCFHHALAVARTQHARSLELRAATSLARLWHHQGKRQEARQVLRDVYGWFTEGFDSTDLRQAQALLEALNVA